MVSLNTAGSTGVPDHFGARVLAAGFCHDHRVFVWIPSSPGM